MMSDFALFGIWYIVFLFSTVAHEAAHGLAAHLGGDSTAYHAGQVTLDPIGHIKRSPIGMVVFPILTFVQMNWMMGWASVPFDPSWGKRHPLRQAVMSLMGPATNFVLAAIGVVAIKLLLGAGVFDMPYSFGFSTLVREAGEPESGSLLTGLATALSVLVNLNVILGLFNLLPVPPLDGAGIVEGFFPQALGRAFEAIRQQPVLQILVFLGAWYIFPYISGPALGWVLGVVYPS